MLTSGRRSGKQKAENRKQKDERGKLEKVRSEERGVRRTRALQEQSLYSGKARSFAGGMEKGSTLTKGFYY